LGIDSTDKRGEIMTMRLRLAATLAAVVLAGAAAAPGQLAYRIPCEVQNADGESLPDVTWQQGTTPLIQLDVLQNGRAVTVTNMGINARMIIGPSATSNYYATASNSVTGATYYRVQWPTVGTNTAGAAWWYTVYFETATNRYWTGNGRLYIEETTSTAEDGLTWQPIRATASVGDGITITNSTVGGRVYLSSVTGGAGDITEVAAGSGLEGGGEGPGAVTLTATGLLARVASLETMTNAVAISATVNGTNYPAVGGVITFTTPASTGETYDDAWTNGITRAAYGDYAGITNPPSIPAAADYSFTNSLVYSLTVNGTNYTPTAGVVTFTTPAPDPTSGTLTNVAAGTWLTGGGAGPDVPISVNTNAVMAAVAAKGYLTAEAQTLQDVVTLGGDVTSGVVTIDAANQRTNTFGGVLTILGRAVTSGEGNIVGDYGFGAGINNQVGDYGFGAGINNQVGDYGFGAGINNQVGDYGFGVGAGNLVGVYGFGAGRNNLVGERGFGVGEGGYGAPGSFVFSDSQTNIFNRTAYTNAFSVRALGGAYFDTPGLTVTGNVAAASFTLGGDEITEWPTGGGGATNIAAGAADSYDYATRTLTWNTNAAAGGTGGGISEATATNIARTVQAEAGRSIYEVASAANIEITPAMGRFLRLILTGSVTNFTFVGHDTNQINSVELDLYKGANAITFNTNTVMFSELLDISASTVTPLFFRRPSGASLRWRVGQ